MSSFVFLVYQNKLPESLNRHRGDLKKIKSPRWRYKKKLNRHQEKKQKITKSRNLNFFFT